MKYVLAAAFSAWSYVAMAQQFVPYVVTEQDHNALVQWLNESPIPPKYANPVMNRLNALEQAAVVQREQAAAAAARVQEKKSETER